MTILSGYTFSKEEVATLLDLDSPPDPTTKKKKKTSAKLGERDLKNNPITLQPRKIKMPIEVKTVPGALLAKKNPNQNGSTKYHVTKLKPSLIQT